ncbi:DNA recombination protein RmuC [Mesoterricola silvestris]|uniref:DNA recombination protein RmuC n=1 Tax=Mesoterricola silvestris TaxID=2927979 RepID=A0AA48GQB1_9BACT|nr:DNA recombination protein RmuC [Mesoterricola silvestris]BDU73750.1 DNA recombination protein RmuC [Mesoterricola silvestris]
MTETLLAAVLFVLVFVAACQVALLRRGPGDRAMREEFARNREEASAAARQARQELAASLNILVDTLSTQFANLVRTHEQKLEAARQEGAAAAKALREEVGAGLKNANDSVLRVLTGLSEAQKKELDALRASVEGQLDAMRATVDEKLQGTLEKRLGESFRLVSERLEQVYRGLGEMQALAAGVGDLKKVLTNVKTRGTWGEVQLGALLEQVLTPDQYEANVAPKGGAERVEYAVRMPGQGDEVVWLPIDAKFPVEDYQRLTEAQERADPVAAEEAGAQLELRIRQCAKDIADKYLNPPRTTDFGILFLPTEGLFAEVIRRRGLLDQVQSRSRVVVAGPTTLWSILNSLQMGFRTLAIQRRSSDVWNLLGAVKTEWTSYGLVLDKVQKKLQQASSTVDEAARRTRAIGRKLRDVQELPLVEAGEVLSLGTVILDEEEEP